MAMAVDSRQQSQIDSLGYDSMRYSAAPQFTNPWGSSPAASTQLYATSLSNSSSLDGNSGHHAGRPTSISLPYHGLQVTAAPLGAGINLSNGLFEPQNLLDPAQDMMNSSRTYAAGYSPSAPQNPNGYLPASAQHYNMDFSNHSRSPYAYAQDAARRSSHSSVPSASFPDSPVELQRQRQSSLVDFDRLNSQSQRNSFSEVLDASQGMLAMSQDITPRNIYGNQGSSRNSTDSYGFPATHSAHSSISSGSAYPYYAGSTADGSVTDYSSASESVADNPRTLPRPAAMATSSAPPEPPTPQSMMTQFSSKVSSSSQKKHKCKVCDKRFTRPSSLQTHMYSHTGEKPFACEVEGCGRHFSVVSNLRRHKKVHKGERDHPSPDDI